MLFPEISLFLSSLVFPLFLLPPLVSVFPSALLMFLPVLQILLRPLLFLLPLPFLPVLLFLQFWLSLQVLLPLLVLQEPGLPGVPAVLLPGAALPDGFHLHVMLHDAFQQVSEYQFCCSVNGILWKYSSFSEPRPVCLPLHSQPAVSLAAPALEQQDVPVHSDGPSVPADHPALSYGLLPQLHLKRGSP